MKSRELWQAFLETGAPEFYLLYSKARNSEDNHVFDDTGAGVASNALQ